MNSQSIDVRPIVGLEIHVQLQTSTKMFCGCPVVFDAPPNSAVCPVCLGHPGTLPVINRRAFQLAMLMGMALDCEIASLTKWDRKSYFYPDMPKNYQISQFDLPVCGPGHFDVPDGDQRHRVRIRRAHLEEDAGKNIHDTPGCTLVDLNRAGTPLLEIVTEPDIESAEQAYAFCTELQRLVVYLGVSEGVMKKGQMRFEPNVNLCITTSDAAYRTPIAEIKNLNSFKSVRNAIAYDIERQLAQWTDDHDYVLGKAGNENRGWNDDRGITEFQRPKEAAHDYRYFPDPDLVPVRITEPMLAECRSALPELPIARMARLVRDYGMKAADASTLIADRPTADLFEAIVQIGAPAEVAAKQFVNVWQRLANDRDQAVADLSVDKPHMAKLALMVSDGAISSTAANQIAEVLVQRNTDPGEIATELGLLQIRDTAATEAWVNEVLAANAGALDDARKNPKKIKAVIGFLRGQVMKQSGGKADPKLVGGLLESKLEELL